jgi:hypothetical protein
LRPAEVNDSTIVTKGGRHCKPWPIEKNDRGHDKQVSKEQGKKDGGGPERK